MQDEKLQCFDENGAPSEVQLRSEEKAHPEKYYCGVANIWLVNDQGQLLVSKRSDWVAGNPSKWQTYFGGHVTAGMSFRETAAKELEEEIGLNGSNELEEPGSGRVTCIDQVLYVFFSKMLLVQKKHITRPDPVLRFDKRDFRTGILYDNDKQRVTRGQSTSRLAKISRRKGL